MKKYGVVGYGTSLLLLVNLFGCALGDRTIGLPYQPTIKAEAPAGAEFALVQFEDTRADKVVVGEVRNSMGLKTAKVVLKDPQAGGWVANALAAELEQSGAKVVKYAHAPATATLPVVTGNISELYTSMYMTYRGSVRLQVIVSRAGVPVLNREYIGKGGGLAVALTAGEYERVAQAALQDALKKAVPDILGVLR